MVIALGKGQKDSSKQLFSLSAANGSKLPEFQDWQQIPCLPDQVVPHLLSQPSAPEALQLVCS